MNSSFHTSRRSLLKGVLATGLAPQFISSRLLGAGANGKINMGFIGTGKQAGGLMNGFAGQTDAVQVVAVCDVDTTRRNHAKEKMEKFYADKGGQKIEAYEDFRQLLARKDIDAVCIATPDHWHAIITVAALNAGKDVYCEKPLVHSVEESLAVIAATKANNRVLQTGSMQRSSKEFRVACELVRNGVLGKVKEVQVSFGVPGKDCDLPEEAMEPGLNWEMWLGPAAKRPYNSILSPRGVHDHFPLWREYWEYGGGYVTDWGAHHLDITQWALGMDESGPIEVIAPENYAKAKQGAKLRYEGDIIVTHANGTAGLLVTGEEGTVEVGRGKFSLKMKGETKAQFMSKEDKTSLDGALVKAEKEFLANAKVKLYATPKGNHLVDFLTCMKSRALPCCPAEIGARSAAVCNIMNFAYRYGQSFGWNPKEMTFAKGGDAAWLKYPYQNGWKIA